MEEPPRKILFSEHFIDLTLKDSDRVNTVLDETYQLTVRKKIYDYDEEDDAIFKTAKEKLYDSSDNQAADNNVNNNYQIEK